jgi:hypothetical protein
MNNRSLAMSSLVMAIPSGFLLYVLGRSIFEYSEAMPTFMTIIVWTLMLIGLLLAISPVIFLFTGTKSGVPATAGGAPVIAVAPKQKPAKKKPAVDDDELTSDDDIAADDDMLNTDDEQLFDTSDEEAGADEFEDNFNFDDDDDPFTDDEEPAPKKKKK